MTDLHSLGYLPTLRDPHRESSAPRCASTHSPSPNSYKTQNNHCNIQLQQFCYVYFHECGDFPQSFMIHKGVQANTWHCPLGQLNSHSVHASKQTLWQTHHSCWLYYNWGNAHTIHVTFFPLFFAMYIKHSYISNCFIFIFMLTLVASKDDYYYFCIQMTAGLASGNSTQFKWDSLAHVPNK